MVVFAVSVSVFVFVLVVKFHNAPWGRSVQRLREYLIERKRRKCWEDGRVMNDVNWALGEQREA